MDYLICTRYRIQIWTRRRDQIHVPIILRAGFLDGPNILLTLTWFVVAETRLQEDRAEGRAADPRGGPADREPERAMTISQPQFTPLAKMRKERKAEREVGPKSRAKLFSTSD